MQKLTSNLEFLSSIGLDYNPGLIKISNKLVCITSASEQSGIYYYNKNDFTLKFKYNHGYARINLLWTCFYEFCCDNRTVYCYDEDGNLTSEINISKFKNNMLKYFDGCIVNFNKNVLISFYGLKKLIKIKIN